MQFNFFIINGLIPSWLKHKENRIRYLITGVSMILAFFSYGSNYKLILKSHVLTIEDTLVSVFWCTNFRLRAIAEEVGQKNNTGYLSFVRQKFTCYSDDWRHKSDEALNMFLRPLFSLAKWTSCQTLSGEILSCSLRAELQQLHVEI